jgi:hypothetical protein
MAPGSDEVFGQLRDHGYEPAGPVPPTEVGEAVRERRPELLLIDDGVDADALASHQLPIVVRRPLAPGATLDRAALAGPWAALPVPCSSRELLLVLEAALATDRAAAHGTISRAVADHAPVKIWLTGPDRACTYFNKV